MEDNTLHNLKKYIDLMAYVSMFVKTIHGRIVLKGFFVVWLLTIGLGIGYRLIGLGVMILLNVISSSLISFIN